MIMFQDDAVWRNIQDLFTFLDPPVLESVNHLFLFGRSII